MVKCNIDGCENESIRTISKAKANNALSEENLSLNIRSKVTKIKICKDHYRKIKKHIKKADKLNRLRWT